MHHPFSTVLPALSSFVQIIAYIGGSLFLAFAAVTLVEIATS
jgi:hypothetical protein